jgi:thiol-disulfide isomerase/thioredoxin
MRRRLVRTGVQLGVLVGWAACATTSPTEKAVLSVQNLACADCGHELEAIATHQPGVRGARFDERRAELALEVVPGTSPQAIAAAFKDRQIDGKRIVVVVGPGAGWFAPFQPLDPAWDARVLSSHGEDVASFAPAPGKVTVVDFYADWCGPCHDLDELMHKLLAENPMLAYRRVNVVDWDSPVAKHYLAAAKGLPYVIVLDTHGREVVTLSGLQADPLKAAIAQGARP